MPSLKGRGGGEAGTAHNQNEAWLFGVIKLGGGKGGLWYSVALVSPWLSHSRYATSRDARLVHSLDTARGSLTRAAYAPHRLPRHSTDPTLDDIPNGRNAVHSGTEAQSMHLKSLGITSVTSPPWVNSISA